MATSSTPSNKARTSQDLLNSVSQICDAGGDDGQLVLLGKWGGTILNLETWRKTPFDRSGGIYTLGAWVKPPGSVAPGFPRQGR